MKKVLAIILFLPFAVKAQTGNVTLTQKADVWAMFIGKHTSSTDSLTLAAIRTVETQVALLNPVPTWSEDLTITGFPAKTVVAMYRDFMNMPAGVIASRYTAIRNSFRAIAALVPYFDAIEAEQPILFNRWRDIGRDRVL
jgi:hypothetical protein